MYQSFIKPLAIDVKTFILDTLFPISCLSCGEEGSFLCLFCRTKLITLENQHCIVCQKPAVAGLTHAACQSPHTADALISFFDYHDAQVSNLIINGKYKFIYPVFEIFGEIMAKKISADFSYILAGDVILTPIPLAHSRKRWRGFNQAEILSQTLSKNLGLTVYNALVRSKSTKTQKDLKKDERIKNVSNAFALVGDGHNRPLPSIDIHNKTIILVDDVVTTGSTLLEAAKVLKRNGATKVICLTIARD